jgi:hypothetical protein
MGGGFAALTPVYKFLGNTDTLSKSVDVGGPG